MLVSPALMAREADAPGPAPKKTKVAPSQDGRFSCTQCQRSFGRIEHLKRHVGSHTEERPFKCGVCGKGFLRSDTLQRHEAIHSEDNDKAKPKGARACFECAAAKVKCSNTSPCARCVGRTLACKYPSEVTAQSPGARPSDDKEEVEQQQIRGSLLPTSDEASDSPLPGLDSSSVRSGRLLPSISSITSSQYQPQAGPTESPHGWDQNWTSMNWLSQSASQDANAVTSVAPTGHASGQVVYARIDQRHALSADGHRHSQGLDEIPNGFSKRWLETVTQSPPLQRESASSTSGSQGQAGTSQFYIDGDGARLPKIGSRRRQTLARAPRLDDHLADQVSSMDDYAFGFLPIPIPHRDALDDLRLEKRTLIDENTHSQLQLNFDRYCSGPQTGPLARFNSSFFPSLEDFRTFIILYIENVQPILPIFHLPTFNPLGHHWILTLAIVALGCQFLDESLAVKHSQAMQEFLRRALLSLRESGCDASIGVELHQARLLHCLGAAYSGNRGHVEAIGPIHLELTDFCKNMWKSAAGDDTASANGKHSALTQAWIAWSEIEQRRRLGYAIWMLDCMLAYHHERQPLLELAGAVVPLPCPEILWEARPASQWEQVMTYSASTPSLLDAMQTIYIEKKIQPTIGEFSRIMIIHGLYRRMWEVGTYLEQPLTWWAPTATRQATHEVVPTNIWLPELPMYSRWRNATCDSLDILHWAANSVIGAASGMEHPTVAHLHLSRVLMLTPISAIRAFASGLTGTKPVDEGRMASFRRDIRRWALEDQCKARLAMVHAGCFYWHLRKFSAAAFYEPHAVLLCALALWAFGTFTDNAYINSRLPEASFVEADEASLPTSINLDRPADDELVQTFIRRGSKMYAMMSGVGDVCAPEGPERLLIEGVKLLTTLANWGCAKDITRLLKDLSRVSRQKALGEG